MKQASTNTVSPVTAGSSCMPATLWAAASLALSASAWASSARSWARSAKAPAERTSSWGVIARSSRGRGGGGHRGRPTKLLVHQAAAGGQQGRLDDLVGPVELQLLGLLVDQRRQEGQQVAGVEAARIRRDPARHVGMGDQLHAVLDDDLAMHGQLAIAAL